MDNKPAVPPDPLIGQLIQGRYRVERVLGQGGMGQVYLAEQVSLKRPIALKVLRGMYDQDEQFIARFQREAEQAARLNHPHIVTIYDFGPLDGGGFFIAMEYVSGPTLGELLKNERVSVPRALQLGIQIAEGLQAAHHAGIIHRDVKPANIVVQEGDQIKLMDFGIARVQDSQIHLTHTGQPIGTPKYMAPEQWGVGTIGPQTDMYALGIVLYQMLSGQAPFSAPTPVLMRMHLDEPPPPLRPLLPDIPPPVEQIVLRALEKQPERRQRDMGELIVALQAILEGQKNENADENEQTELLTPDSFTDQEIPERSRHEDSRIEQPLSKSDSSQAPRLAPVEPRVASQPPPEPSPTPLPASPPPAQAAQTHKPRRPVAWLGVVLGVALAGFLGFQFFPEVQKQVGELRGHAEETQQKFEELEQPGQAETSKQQREPNDSAVIASRRAVQEEQEAQDTARKAAEERRATEVRQQRQAAEAEQKQADAAPSHRGGQMVLVPAGTFWMGCNEKVDNECNADEKPGREVQVKASISTKQK
jgi:serine/threonine protein kinase